MIPVKTILVGLTDPAQAVEVARLGPDAIVLEIGEDGPTAICGERADEVISAFGPLTTVFAALQPGRTPPKGCRGIVAALADDAPEPGLAQMVWVPHVLAIPERIPSDVDLLWVRPRKRGSSTATRFDYRRIERLSRRFRVALEVDEGAAGVETAIRLGSPYGLVFAHGVWYRPGFIDTDRLEQALAVVARVNKQAFHS